MSDGAALVKVVAVLGMIIVLTSSVTGFTPPAWTALKNSLSVGITFPTFDNPFSQRIQLTLLPAANGTSPYLPPDASTDTFGNVDHCDNTTTGEWWGCLLTSDGNASFVSVTSASGSPFSIVLEEAFGLASSFPVLAVSVNAECRATGGTPVRTLVEFDFLDGGSLFQLVTPIFCDPGAYASRSIRQELSSPYFTVGNYSGASVQIVTDAPQLVDYTSLSVVIEYSPIVQCTGDALPQIACQFGQFFNFVINAIKFVINGLAFIFVSIGVVLFFIGSVVTNLLLGTISVFGVMFNLGAPSPVQEIIDVMAIVAIAFVIFIVVSLIRGTEG